MPSPRALPLLEQKLILASRGFASLGAKAVGGLRGKRRGQNMTKYDILKGTFTLKTFPDKHFFTYATIV